MSVATPKFHALGALQIPRGMVWADEFGWNPVEKSLDYSVTGAALIDAAVRLAGRPITLQGEADAGWIARGGLLALQALNAADAVGEHVLVLADGRSFAVQFAPGLAVEARPVARPELPVEKHPYVATVRLITV
ncbi:hypothetical protein [Variovorax paradoxus]|jgi:hypothetical protein|uniref:Uncharacterized protein n=1 Tax=Variovorax paradoxus TaxID=34073 RepID=A0A679J7J5_VARPD|nr:hypothetical protein VVAX_04067 [Variovorax paradoxus]CAA2108210.1 hypothetical protein VVAX_04720 [Variovorax paradoxus]